MTDVSSLLKNRLKTHNLIYTLEAEIKAIINKIPKNDLLRLSTDITLLVANYVENHIKNTQIDKKALTIEIINDVYNLTDDEKKIVSEQIDFLISTGQIKKDSLTTVIASNMKSYVKSFFLKTSTPTT